MIKRSTTRRGDAVRITFVLPVDEVGEPVSVLGDFNGWDPLAHPLKKRSNGTRSAAVEVPAGSEHQFKYLAEGGRWFCDDEADATVANEYAELNSVVRL